MPVGMVLGTALSITVLVSSEEAILRVAVDVSPRVRFGNGNRQTQETRQSPGRPFPARVRTRRLPNMGGQAPVLLRPADFDLAQCAYSHAPAAEWQEIFAEAQVPYASAKIMGCTKFFIPCGQPRAEKAAATRCDGPR